MLNGIEVLYHSSIRFTKEKTIYVDPYKICKSYNDADIIFCTHSHYDHFSEEDIMKVKKEESIIVVTSDCLEGAKKMGFSTKNILVVEPNNKYEVLGVNFETIPAYNLEKEYHKKEYNWVGYIIELNDITYYIAGDTDVTSENKSVNCDVAFLPIGGKYTMNAKEAANLANIIEPQIAIPIHYGSIVGTLEDAQIFKDELNNNIECMIMMNNS